LRDRTTDLHGLQVRTLNALGLAVLDGRAPFAPRRGRYAVLDERATRQILSGLVEVPRRLNTDPLAPWLDALAEVRLGLRPPSAVEATYDGDVDGLAVVLDRYRGIMRDRHAVDFNEQIATAIEVLLAEPLCGSRPSAPVA
jgi:DNA helicase-2/ATP-dependent DNA helicase PcrA